MAAKTPKNAHTAALKAPTSAAQSALSDTHHPDQRHLSRTINEEIYRISTGFDGELELVCECVRPDCFSSLRGSRTEYAEVRRIPDRFVVDLNHYDPGSELLVHETKRFAVIENAGPDLLASTRPGLLGRPPSSPDGAGHSLGDGGR